MALSFQNVTVGIDKGVHTRLDDRNLPPGYMSELLNAEYVVPNRISKRSGYEAKSREIITGGTIDAAVSISAIEGQLFAFDGKNAYLYIDTANKWRLLGTCWDADAEFRPIESTVQNIGEDVTAAYVGGYVCFFSRRLVSGTTHNIHVTIYDVAGSGEIVRADEFLVASSSAGSTKNYLRAVPMSNSIILIYKDTLNQLAARKIIPSDAVLSAPAWVAADLVDGFFDAVSIDGTTGVVAYSVAGGLRIRSFTTGGISNTQSNTSVSSPSTDLSLVKDSNSPPHLYTIVGTAASSVRVSCFDFDASLTLRYENVLLEAFAPNSPRYTTGHTSGNDSINVYYESEDPIRNYIDVRKSDITSSGVVGVPSYFKRNARIASKPFTLRGEEVIALVFDSTTQGSVFVLNSSTEAISRVGFGSVMSPYTSDVAFSDNETVYFAKRTIVGFEPNGTTVKNGLSWVRLSSSTEKHCMARQDFNKSAWILGSQLYFFDGNLLTEQGFHVYPQVKFVNFTAGGLGAGTYSYKIIYSWRDAQGRIHESSPSDSETGVTVLDVPAASRVNFLIRPLYMTNKNNSLLSSVKIGIYRTEANGTIHYLVDEIVNDITTASGDVPYSDQLSDSVLRKRRILYTEGGAVSNIPVPSPSYIERLRGRLFCIVGGNELWFSKRDSVNRGPSFATQFVIVHDGVGGSWNSLGKIDGKLLIFSTGSVFGLTGDGPNDLDQGEFSGPEQISAHFGCRDILSVVSSENGVWFRSARGVYTVDRGLTPIFLGAPAQTLTDTKVIGSTFILAKNQVRFLTESGLIAVYDTAANAWTTFSGILGISSTIYRGNHWMVLDDGTPYEQSGLAYLDGIESIPRTVATSWINLGGLQGYDRIRRASLLLRKGEADQIVTVDLFRNYNDATAFQSVSFNTSTLVSEPTQFNIHLSDQKLESLKIRITETGESNARTVDINGIMLEVAGKSGLFRLSPGQTL